MIQINRVRTASTLLKIAGVTCGFTAMVATSFGAEEMIPLPPEPQRTAVEVPNLLTYGAFEIRPYFVGGVSYDDNIRLQPTNALEDVVWHLSPGILIGAGAYRSINDTYISLDYHPVIMLYTDHNDENYVDHFVRFGAQRKWEKLTLGLSQSVSIGDGGATEAINRISRQMYITLLTVDYRLSDKTSFELNGTQNISDYDDFNSYNEWLAQVWANYQATTKMNVGLGGTLGFRDVRNSPNQVYEQMLVRANYLWTDKITLKASAGAEFSQYQDGQDYGPVFIFSLGGTYQPRETTTFSLLAYRRSQVSIVASGQNYIATGVSADLRQRIGRQFSLGIVGGYEESDYHSVLSGAAAGRHDRTYFVGPTLDWNLTERWSASLFYRYRDAQSNDPLYGYAQNQVGLRSTYRF